MHPSSNKRKFDKADPRLKFSLNSIDPRIHFALNCGAKSCPPIRIYSEENLEEDLDKATQDFVTASTSIDVLNDTVILTKLFLWYREDFLPESSGWDKIGSLRKAVHFKITTKEYDSLKWLTSIEKDDRMVLSFVLKYLKPGDRKRDMLRGMLSNDTPKIKYAPYDFAVNRNDFIE